MESVGRTFCKPTPVALSRTRTISRQFFWLRRWSPAFHVPLSVQTPPFFPPQQILVSMVRDVSILKPSESFQNFAVDTATALVAWRAKLHILIFMLTQTVWHFWKISPLLINFPKYHLLVRLQKSAVALVSLLPRRLLNHLRRLMSQLTFTHR